MRCNIFETIYFNPSPLGKRDRDEIGREEL
jgi:hypothetical protein